MSIVGISLGGKAVLDHISRHPGDADAAIVSGVTIAPPNETAEWEKPRLPDTDHGWMSIIMEDVGIVGMEEAQRIQEKS